MAKFDSFSEEKEFKALNAKRGAVLVELSRIKKSLEALSKDKPSIRSFERIEAKFESKVEQLEAANEAVSSYFSKMGEIHFLILVLMIIVILQPILLGK